MKKEYHLDLYELGNTKAATDLILILRKESDNRIIASTLRHLKKAGRIMNMLQHLDIKTYEIISEIYLKEFYDIINKNKNLGKTKTYMHNILSTKRKRFLRGY